MEYRYCVRCKKLFTMGTIKMCAECVKEIDQAVLKIREYLDEHPRANIKMIASETDVSERDILYLLREDRVVLVNSGIICDKCGEPIEKGRFCTKCQNAMKMEFDTTARMLREKINGGENKEDESAESFLRQKNGADEMARREKARREAARKMLVLEKYREKHEYE